MMGVCPLIRFLASAAAIAICLVRPFGGPVAQAGELKVVVTIKPIHALVAAVMQGAGTPRLLIEGSGSPHTFTLKPSDAKVLNEARVFFRVSEGLEPFTGKILKSLPKTVQVVTLESTPGLTLLNLRSSATFEAHDHDAGKLKRGHNHAHDHAGAKPAAIGGSVDGHIWLDPANARLMVTAIAEVLATAAPEHAQLFRSNAGALDKRLEQLDGEIQSALAPMAGKPYIVFHDAYQYLESRYGLTPSGSVSINPDVPPSVKRLTELRRKISGLKATCVFAEPQFAPKVIETIIEGTSARRGTLDPLGASLPAGPEHYPALMRALAADLKSCLANPS